MPLGSIIGGIMGSSGANAAGAAASASSKEAGQEAYNRAQATLQRTQGDADRAVGRVSPWIQSGYVAAQQVNALLGLGKLTYDGKDSFYADPTNAVQDQKDAAAKFVTDPGYQFRLQQGTNALDRSAAARGSVLSGAQQKAVSDYGQNTGSAEYANYFNRLQGISGQGLTAANAGNNAYAQAMAPGYGAATAASGRQFQGDLTGGLTQASDMMAGSNMMASGVTNAFNNAVGLLSFGGSGGKLGLPKFA